MREFLHTYMNIAELNILKTLSSKCRKTKFSIVFLHKLKIFMQSCDPLWTALTIQGFNFGLMFGIVSAGCQN